MEQIFYVKTDDLSIMKELQEDLMGDAEFVAIDHPDKLMDPFDKNQLITIRTAIRGKEAKGDEKKSQKKLAYEIFEAVFKEPKAKAKSDKPAKEKKPTKMSLIREILAKGPIKKDDLAEAIGSDGPNTHTMISILGNEKRTKDPILVAYNKVTTVYTLCADADELAKVKEENDTEFQANRAEKKKKEMVHSEGPEKEEGEDDWKGEE